MRAPAGAGAGRPRVLLFGASNLTRALPLVVSHAERACGGAVDIFAAGGNGRSYGLPSHAFGRDLPAILDCGLWAALAEAPPAGPAYALIADIGNDIAYGATVADIRAWIAACVDRLASHQARLVVLQLPLASLKGMSERQVWFLRRLVFPAGAPEHAVALARAEELASGVAALARTSGAALIEQEPWWFGFDPIHIRYPHLAKAWSRILQPWGLSDAEAQRPSLWRSLHVRALPPEHRWVLGRESRRPQPAARLRSGTRLFLY